VALANRIAVLPHGHAVDKVGEGPAGWWKVRTRINGTTVDGFASSRHLAAQHAAAVPPSTGIRPVHLAEHRQNVTRASTTGRAFPLGEPNAPRRVATLPAARLQQLHAIVAWLDVERSARYERTPESTFCNIYAYDFCYLAGVYLPRVWWTGRALANLAAGRAVAPKYGDTVREVNVNALYEWLEDFGAEFGWHRTTELDDLQAAANAGGVGLICAQRKDLDRSGHVCVIVPERPESTARRNEGRVHLPLQSQAGARNFCYSCGTARWWTGNQFRAFGFWVHD
jgi:hypothetical protein